jgi:hypothetical protein
MNSQRQNKARRHPLVRFLRGIVRLFKVVFGTKSKQRNLKSPEDFQQELRVAELDRRDRVAESRTSEQLITVRETLESQSSEQLITVGEIFNRVKWQQPNATIFSEQKSVVSTIARPLDVSRN